MQASKRVTVNEALALRNCTAEIAIPASVKECINGTLIRNAIHTNGFDNVQRLLEVELIRLASRLNIANNLQDHQIPFIAESLIEMYPLETIESFIYIFTNGARGRYGKLFHTLDLTIINEWIQRYIEEKLNHVEQDYNNQKNKALEESKEVNDSRVIELIDSAISEIDKLKQAEELEHRKLVLKPVNSFLFGGEDKIKMQEACDRIALAMYGEYKFETLRQFKKHVAGVDVIANCNKEAKEILDKAVEEVFGNNKKQE